MNLSDSSDDFDFRDGEKRYSMPTPPSPGTKYDHKSRSRLHSRPRSRHSRDDRMNRGHLPAMGVMDVGMTDTLTNTDSGMIKWHKKLSRRLNVPG